MSKGKKTALLPKLRFPEFRDEWQISSLGNISKPIEKRAGEKAYTLMSVTSGVGLVSQKEKFGREIAGNAYKNYFVIEKGDFAYNKSATKQFPEGYIAMLFNYEEAALPNSIFTCFRITDKNCCPAYLNQLFQSNYHGSWLRNFIAIGARAHGSLSIDNKHLWEMPVAVPMLPEQQKIADCLSSLDELISAEEQKLAALKAHKKGLMQKLFPAKGETVPERRFPEFRNSGGWEEKRLEDFCKIIGGGTPSTQNQENWTGKYPWISSSDLAEDNIFKINVTRYITKDAIDNSATKLIPPNSVIMVSRVGVGKVALNSFELCTSQDFTNLTEIEGVTYFLAYYMSNKMLKEANNSQGTSIKGVTVNVIKNYLILLPTMVEQQKIADCLSSVDDLITAQAQKIEALKLHKKGLMQGLFPSMEDVTA